MESVETPQATEPEAPPETPPEAPVEEPKGDRPEENHVAEARRRQQKAEREARELRKQIEDYEDRNKSDLERAIKRAEKAEQRAQELEQRTTSMERGGWVRRAAGEAKFIDPEDALAHISLDGLEDERDAERAVKDLAKRKKHLVQGEEKPAPEIGKVLDKGQPAQPARPQDADRAFQQQQAEQVLAAVEAARKQGV